MPLTLAFMPVLPKHGTNVERFADSTLDIPVASGPYVIASIKPGEELMLRRNPDYWGRDLPVCRGLYNFDEIAISYYRDANSMFESFKAGLIDYRDESNPTRWKTGYDFPAMRDGRVVREQLKVGRPRGMEGFAFNTRHEIVRRRARAGSAGDHVRFRMDQPQPVRRLYTRTTSFFDNSELASTGRAASLAERALLKSFPGAVRDDILEGRWRPVTDGTGRDREQARQALALLARPAGSTRRPRQKDGDRSNSRSWRRTARRSGWR